MHADLGAAAAAHRVEVHRSRRDDVRPWERPPREDLAFDLVDDLGVPFNNQPAGPGGFPMRLAVGRGRHPVEVRHELRQIVEASPETVGVGDRHFQANRLPNMNSALAAEGRTCGVGLCVAVDNVRPMAGDASIQQRR